MFRVVTYMHMCVMCVCTIELLQCVHGYLSMKYIDSLGNMCIYDHFGFTVLYIVCCGNTEFPLVASLMLC